MLFAAAGPARADERYVDDFKFLQRTVQQEAAAPAVKKLDWAALSAPFAARFAACTNDVDHVKNVMELLATLRDSHTGVTETKVDRSALPSKFDGLFGAGLWFGWDDGRFVLRGIMEGHSLASTLPLGAELLTVGDEPAWFALERERRRAARFAGSSSDHSFFASLSNRLLPFGAARTVATTFLLPDEKARPFTLDRWGPGGHAFDFVGAFLPAGLPASERASSMFLPAALGPKWGFLKITGAMDAPTVRAFHAAFDALKGMEALLLDCRAMGGGGDEPAWEMAGRLYSKPVQYGRRQLVPTGAWQFDGPVVMLQDETEVSSAETFTWAVSETGRVVSVGRPTGGWGIIPRGFDLPSGLASFRLGVNARATPLQGIATEGVGWPPDLVVPFGPEITKLAPDFGAPGHPALPDPVAALGLEVLRVLHAGVARDEARTAFHALGEGNLAAFQAFAKKAAAKAKGFDGTHLAKLFADDLRRQLALERAALAEADVAPDLLGAERRLPRLLARAKGSGLASEAAALEKAIKAAPAEGAAQAALLALLDADFAAPEAAQKAFLAKHGTTRVGRFAKEWFERSARR